MSQNQEKKDYQEENPEMEEDEIEKEEKQEPIRFIEPDPSKKMTSKKKKRIEKAKQKINLKERRMELFNELSKIMDLLVDYMIRYRIVGLSNGSADLRNTLFTILTKITSEEIEISYDNIRYELSNSPSPNGRFPNDEEFKLALQSKVNISGIKNKILQR